jgi:hypothetical protein
MHAVKAIVRMFVDERTALIEIFACVFLFNTGLIAFHPGATKRMFVSL